MWRKGARVRVAAQQARQLAGVAHLLTQQRAPDALVDVLTAVGTQLKTEGLPERVALGD